MGIEKKKKHLQRIKKVWGRSEAQRMSGSGRPAVKLPPKQANKMIIMSEVGVSQEKWEENMEFIALQWLEKS